MQTSLVTSLSEARRTLSRMWLQPTEEITKHAKGNDNWWAIITEELKSHLKRLSYKKGDKGKKKGLLDFDFDFLMATGREILFQREKLGAWESYWTLRLRETTNSYSGSRIRKPTNRSRIHSVIPTVQKIDSDCTCNSQSHQWT